MLVRMNEGLAARDQVGVFDFALQRVLYKTLGFGAGTDNMIIYPARDLDVDFWHGAWTEGFVDMRGERNIPLVYYKDQLYSRLVYTFVSNHDDDGLMKMYGKTEEARGYQDEGFVSWTRIVPAYFIVLLLPGIPCVWGAHFYWFKELETLIQLRNYLKIQPGARMEVDARPVREGVITWRIFGADNTRYTCAVIGPSAGLSKLPAPLELVFELKTYDAAKPFLLHVYL